MDNKQMHDWIWEAIQASVEAGKAILNIYETDFEVTNKADSSPLTRADLESHNVISRMLEGTGIPILSEEGKDMSYDVRRDWGLFWLVDPLDGTKEFVNRNGEFTVNIALIKESFPVAGVIYIPVTDELYVGMENRGSYKVSEVKKAISEAGSLPQFMETGQILPQDTPGRPYTVIASRSHMSTETEAFIDELRAKHDHLELSSRGSSLKLCMVAEGKADIYPRFAPTMEWDTAAGQAIAECSGAGVVQAHSRKRLRYNKEDLLNPWFIVER
jgi:3'(2'), 5'-bisphosphate nucleotidase